MFRRALLVATMTVLLWAAPASAQVVGDPVGDYPPTVVPTSLVASTTVPPVTRPPAVTTPPGPEVEATSVEGGLARTGAGNIGPLIQAAIVLLGAGALLVLVARRRRAERRAATTA